MAALARNPRSMEPWFRSLFTVSVEWTSALFRYGGVRFADVSAHVHRLKSLANTSDFRQKTVVALFLKLHMLCAAQRAQLILTPDWSMSTFVPLRMRPCL